MGKKIIIISKTKEQFYSKPFTVTSVECRDENGAQWISLGAYPRHAQPALCCLSRESSLKRSVSENLQDPNWDNAELVFQ